ncbi:MAG: hypothetical protein ABEL04_14195 [Salinibacter sp.]|uniref:hypothetical protein n=1 Tax=Salinibacter sp. TaxID=2065818 RepID=UPI0035D4C19C
MTAAQLHLALNHIPVLGTLLGAVFLAYGLWRGQETVQNVSLGLLVFVGAVAVAVYLTGEPAEEIIEGAAGVSHDAIEAHETWAWYALIASVATGLGALGALVLESVRQQLARWTVQAVLVLALLTSGVVVYTANLGGKINHPELRASTTAVDSPATPETESGDSESE